MPAPAIRRSPGITIVRRERRKRKKVKRPAVKRCPNRIPGYLPQ